MPNTFIGHRDRWIALSEIDYLGQFVKAWMAFNAWYRSNYAERQDRKIINEFKWQPNVIRNKLMPLMTRTDSGEAEELRAEIGLLHHRLETYLIESGRDDEKERITLTQAFLRDRPPFNGTEMYRSYTCKVERPASGKIETNVSNPAGVAVFVFSQPRFNVAELDGNPGFAALPVGIRPKLRNLYQKAAPREIVDLLTFDEREGGEPPIHCGSFVFPCGKKALFAGVAEVIYSMRCTLFHGELKPTHDASRCYEPAYRIVRRYIDAAS